MLSVMVKRLDDIDFRILDALQADSRVPLVRLARELGVSDTTVRARIDRLVRQFGVRFVVDIDPEILGLNYSFLAVRVQGPAMSRTVERMNELPEIIYLGRTLGGYDLIAELVCRDNEDSIRVLDTIRAIPGITQVDTFSVLRTEKENWQFTDLARG